MLGRPVLDAFSRWGHPVHMRKAAETDENMADASERELVERKIHVAREAVVLIKGICEASEGVCAMFAERGGDLVLAAPRSRARDLDELVRDLASDFGAREDE